MVSNFHNERGIALFCDLHGHSNMKNVFMYGCYNESDPQDTRMFPYALSKVCPHFSFEDSKFGNQKSKERTARMALWNTLKIPTIYTMEASFCGCTQGPLNNCHFTTAALREIGRDLCRSLITYCDLPLINSVSNIQYNDQTKPILQEAYSIFNKKKLLEELGKLPPKSNDLDDPGSDSEPSDGNLNERLLKHIIPIGKNGKIIKCKVYNDQLPTNIFLQLPKSNKEDKVKKEEASEKNIQSKMQLVKSKIKEVVPPIEIPKLQAVEPSLAKPNMHDKATQFDRRDFNNSRLKVIWKHKKNDIRERTSSVKLTNEEEVPQAKMHKSKERSDTPKTTLYLSHYSSGNSPRKIIDSYKPLAKDKKYTTPQIKKRYASHQPIQDVRAIA